MDIFNITNGMFECRLHILDFGLSNDSIAQPLVYKEIADP